MKYLLAALTVCIVTAAAVPAGAQPANRDPHSNRAVLGPGVHDDASNASSARGPVLHPISRHGRIHYRQGTHAPQHRKIAHAPRVVRTFGGTTDQLNREELARLQGEAQMPAAAPNAAGAPAVPVTPRALEGSRAGPGAR